MSHMTIHHANNNLEELELQQKKLERLAQEYLSGKINLRAYNRELKKLNARPDFSHLAEHTKM